MATGMLIKSMTYLPSELPEFVHLDDRYKCLICHQVLHVPMMSQCGHRMCKSCLEEYLNSESRHMCPAGQDDCIEISLSEMLPDFGIHREIQKLDVYCSNKEHGCKQIMPWVKLKDHLAVCPYTLEDCANKGFGCKARVIKLKMKEHLESECKFRTVLCPHCNVCILESQLSDHIENACSSVSVVCPYKCGEQSVLRSALEAHKQVCQAKPKDCQYKDMGCTFSGTEDDVKQHEAQSTSYHLQIMHSHLQALERENLTLKNKLQKLEKPDSLSENLGKEIMSKCSQVEQRQELQENSIKNTQKLVATLNISVKNSNDQVQKLREELQSVTERVGAIINASTDRELGLLNEHVRELDFRLQCVETSSFDGVLKWRIRNYKKRKQEAVSGKTLSLYSQPFYTSRYGYKACGRVYLNGDGMGKGTHLSLFFVLLRGDYDALLPWPFRKKVTLTLIDQETGRKNIVDSFRADPTSKSFKRPTTDMNIASGCPLFAPQSVVESSPYLKDDCIFLMMQIEDPDPSVK